MVFQQFNLFPHKSALANVRLAQEKVLGRSREEANEKARGAAEPCRPRRQAPRVPRPPLGRSAAARRDRPRAGDGPARDALRRGHLGARSRARQGGPRRDPRARRGGHDDDHRHPRDRLRPRGRHPRRLHGQRRHRRGGTARAGDRQPAARSAPASSSGSSSSTEPIRLLCAGAGATAARRHYGRTRKGLDCLRTPRQLRLHAGEPR